MPSRIKPLYTSRRLKVFWVRDNSKWLVEHDRRPIIVRVGHLGINLWLEDRQTAPPPSP